MASFSRDRWRTLSPYLDEALEMPADERAAWLASIQARDAALGAELQALLVERDIMVHARFLEGTLRDDLDT